MQAINHYACEPDVADSGEYALNSDDQSFGVIMLELLTGRKPFDSSRTRAGQSLVRWATSQLHDIDALTKMVDPTLEGLFPAKSLSCLADVIASSFSPPGPGVFTLAGAGVPTTNVGGGAVPSSLGSTSKHEQENQPLEILLERVRIQLTVSNGKQATGLY
ncbi:hypothetical protein KSS87_009483 [Heliosperma pusillum]|nr:hypothetical protein KSS87_009483 [Heliosperma pusillum]